MKINTLGLLMHLEGKIITISGKMDKIFRQAGLPGEKPFSTLAQNLAVQVVKIEAGEAGEESVEEVEVAVPPGYIHAFRLAVELRITWERLQFQLRKTACMQATVKPEQTALRLALEAVAYGAVHETIEQARLLVLTTQLALSPHVLDINALKGTRFWPTDTGPPPQA